MSGRKNTLNPFVSTGDMSASFQTAPTSIEFLDRAFLTIETTGTPTGQVTVQASLDYDPRTAQGVSGATWFDVSEIALPALTGTPDNYVVDIMQTAIRFIRVKYARTGGTGTLTAKVSGKES